MDDFMFFGTKSEFKSFEQKEGKKKELDSQKRQSSEEEHPKENTNIIDISADDTSVIDDDTLRILKRTRHRNDVQTIYMQSDTSFYDVYYKSSEDSVIDDKELLQEARSINRIYKSYPKYLHALDVRDEYIDKLIDKVGSEELFVTLLRAGGIAYWIPPTPIYSKRAEDYEDGSDGIIDTSVLFDWDDDWLEYIIEKKCVDMGFQPDGSDIEVTGSVCTDIPTINHSDLVGIDHDARNSGGKSVNLSDMDELQKMFRGWYQDDTDKAKSEKTDNSLEERAFSMTPDKIRQRYFMSRVADMNKEFNNALNGIPNEEPYDPNEMVYDPVLGRPMSRKELESRTLIRQLKESGWTESLRLMKLLGVGSSREYSIMKNKNKKRKRTKNKKRSGTYANDIYGELDTGYQALSDLDSLKLQMFPD